MPFPDIEITAFLKEAGWAQARMAPITGDASARHYSRLIRADTKSTVILMDARGIALESTRSFLDITDFLLTHGFSAPEIYAKSKTGRMLILEDLGPTSLASYSQMQPAKELAVYSIAIDVLARLRNCAPPTSLERYDPENMAKAISPVFDFYCPNSPDGAELIAELETSLATFSPDASNIALRDYHSENLLWMPQKTGIRRIGLIDYQDAVIAHPAYDLASILRDVRHDVSPEMVKSLMEKYIKTTGENAAEFKAAFAIQGVQRNLRILGVFARLCIVAGKQGYIDLIPRVWKNLNNDLDHPTLAKLKTHVLKSLPEPTPEHMNRLRSLCKTNQTL